jgi:hypothetical protein
MTEQESILYFAAIDLEVFGTDLRAGEPWTKPATGSDVAIELRAYGVRYKPSAWLDRRLSGAERKRFSRAAADLQRRRLIVATRSTRTITHVKPTAKGLHEARRILVDVLDWKAVRIGLNATAWATTAMKRATVHNGKVAARE